MANEPKVRLRGLFKIFGPKDKEVSATRQEGMGKEDLLEQHQHVLGSARHQRRHASGRDHRCDGPVRFWQIDAYPSPEPFD